MKTQKESVRLRQRVMATGNVSLYLDIYINGKRSYEYLHLYLVPEKNKADKAKNKETLQFAEAIKAKRIVELRNKEYGFKNHEEKNVFFFDYFLSLTEKKNGSRRTGDKANWYACYHHLRIFEKNERITLADITPLWIEKFKEYLDKDATLISNNDKRLSHNTKGAYFNKLKNCINNAFDDEIISSNPMQKIKGFKDEESMRMYLTLDEVKKLAKTDCMKPRIKDMFLFSCLTGLRWSDVIQIQWGDVQKQGNYTRIIFRQQKTKGQEYLDINTEASLLMGERKEPNENVFTPACSALYANIVIKKWVKAAGIEKKITFHCARHTFATLMLDLGTDIYTVSKLLGHSNIATTQIYAKVLDKNKQKAVSNIPSII